jgi:hypothetical protein
MKLFQFFTSGREKIFEFFFGKGPPLCSKLAENFPQPDVTIHTPIESPSRADKKHAVFTDGKIDFCPKKA